MQVKDVIICLAMKQFERSQATQTRLVSVARELFGSKGYAATSLEELVAAAGVTKGAFYHHFADKEAIFRRVFEDAERDILAKVVAGGARATTAHDRLRDGCRAFLEACLDPVHQRIVLDDGPKVLGWATWRAIEWSYTLSIIEMGLEQAMAEGRLAKRPTSALAHLFFGALCEGSVYIARAPQPEVAFREVAREVDDFVAVLLNGPRPRLADGRLAIESNGIDQRET